MGPGVLDPTLGSPTPGANTDLRRDRLRHNLSTIPSGRLRASPEQRLLMYCAFSVAYHNDCQDEGYAAAKSVHSNKGDT